MNEKKPNTKYRRPGVNLSLLAKMGHRLIRDRKGRRYVFDEKGTMRRMSEETYKALTQGAAK